eukprot:g4702.t1
MSQTNETADRVETPQSPTLCSMNCGFFSNPECKSMCSICYRKFFSNEKEAKNTNQYPDADTQTQTNAPLKTDLVQITPNIALENVGIAAKRPRSVCCPMCRKKLGLLAFQCRCGNRFCETHRYPESHHCTFDHKAALRIRLQAENPVVLNDKVDRV